MNKDCRNQISDYPRPAVSWLLALVITILVGARASIQAHPAAERQRYVAASGQDRGACQDSHHPCRTIYYALDQAEKGDEIRVATGVYFVGYVEIEALLSDAVPVQGGYSLADGFAVQDPAKNPTHLLGVSFTYRAELYERGFNILQDAKGWPLDTPLKAKRPPYTNAQMPPAPCEGGMAGIFPCRGVDFVGQIALAEFSSNPAGANDIWGFVDLNDNREYALIGLQNGTALVEVTDPEKPVEVGTIPGLRSIWRDVKVYQFYNEAAGRWEAYAYVTADLANQGLQIIDLTALPNSVSLAATYSGFSMAHNIYLSYIDYTTGLTRSGSTAYAYIAGSNLDQGAFRVLDLSDPLAPLEVTAPPLGAGYAHDVTTLVITDSRAAACSPDHDPCEVLIDYNETTIELWDVTDKISPLKLGSTSYQNAAYIHSGWWSEDKQFVFIQDESDERDRGLNTTLRTLDISDLTAPVVSNVWTGPTAAIDHNGFVKGDRYYMSNYRRGLTILDISDPNAPAEIAFFDTYPASDSARYNGAWGVYPYLPSGTILISDIERGLILVRKAGIDAISLYLPLVFRN